MSSREETTAPFPRERAGNGDVKINLNRLGVIVGVLAGIAAAAGAYFILPYRMDAAEKKQEIFEIKTERRFEANEAESRQQREILIRIDENVKSMKEAQARGR